MASHPDRKCSNLQSHGRLAILKTEFSLSRGTRNAGAICCYKILARPKLLARSIVLRPLTPAIRSCSSFLLDRHLPTYGRLFNFAQHLRNLGDGFNEIVGSSCS
jgi:hypothetical protein